MQTHKSKGARGAIIIAELNDLQGKTGNRDESRSIEHPSLVVPKRKRRVRSALFFACILIVIGAFILLAIFSSANPYFPVDLRITLTLQTYTPAWFGALMQAVSWFGYMPQAALLVTTLGLVIYLSGYPWEAAMSVVSAIGVEILDFIVKYIVRQPRPSPSLVHVARALTSYSFPSGHVMFYSAYFGFLIFLCFTLLKSSWLRTLLLVILILLIALVGLSRIYLGEHWSSDVLAGYLLGSLFLLGMILVYRNFKPRFFAQEDKLDD